MPDESFKSTPETSLIADPEEKNSQVAYQSPAFKKSSFRKSPQ